MDEKLNQLLKALEKISRKYLTEEEYKNVWNDIQNKKSSE